MDTIEQEIQAKVLPAGEPLVVTCWTCPACGKTKRGGPPPACFEAPERDGCPVGTMHPVLRAMQPLGPDGRPL